MKKRLAIFDFDGTLYDTVPANAAAYAAALARCGVTLDTAYFAEHCNGRYYRYLWSARGSLPAILCQGFRCIPWSTHGSGAC